MKALKYIKGLFVAPSAEAMALKELEAAKRLLLEAHTGREYAEFMAKYHETRIRRLTIYLHTATETKAA